MLVLNGLVRKSSDLLEFNQTHKSHNVFIQVRNICFTDTSHLVLLEFLFVLKVKLGSFMPIYRCAFGFNLKYIFRRYASRTLRMKLMTWCKVISLAGLFGSDRARI